MSKAVLPKKDIHIRINRNGKVRVPKMNWRRVRPREIRARKRPTKVAQAIHHAQKKRVQDCIQVSTLAWSSAKAKVSMVQDGNFET